LTQDNKEPFCKEGVLALSKYFIVCLLALCVPALGTSKPDHHPALAFPAPTTGVQQPIPDVSIAQVLWTGVEAERNGMLDEMTAQLHPKTKEEADYVKGVFRGILFVTFENGSPRPVREVEWSMTLLAGASDTPPEMKVFNETDLDLQPGRRKTIYRNCAIAAPMPTSQRCFAMITAIKFSDGTSWSLPSNPGDDQLRELAGNQLLRGLDQGVPWDRHVKLIEEHLQEIKKSLPTTAGARLALQGGSQPAQQANNPQRPRLMENEEARKQFSAPMCLIREFHWSPPMRSEVFVTKATPRPGVFRLRLWNTGTKTIRRVVYAVTFHDMVAPTGEDSAIDGAYLLSDRTSITPGNGVELIDTFDYWPTPPSIEAVAVIMGLEFSDGTTWKRDLP
jgi:hypothetical protein